MSPQERFIIVGAGLAGAKAAQTLRQEGFTGHIDLVGAESEPPYERPPLSKGYLVGEVERDSAYVHQPAWYHDHGVDLRLGVRATGLESTAHEVTLATGERIGYDKLLLATGSSPRRLTVPGADLDGVHYLRQIQDADRLRTRLTAGGRSVLVIGGGWIGLEVAAAARAHGCNVTLVEPQPTPLRAALGPELGGMFADLHREHGVDLRLSTGVQAVVGQQGRVTGVIIDTGEELPADLVVVGIGVRPNTEIAQAAGLKVDNGIVVDEAMGTSDPDVYAAGDVANSYYPSLRRHLRVEHWANALYGGPAAARSMLGQPVSYDRIPYFFSDQYDLGMEYFGHVEPGGHHELVCRGERGGRQFMAFWLAGGRVVAGMTVNVRGVRREIQALIRSRVTVDSALLADPDVPLAELIPSAPGQQERP